MTGKRHYRLLCPIARALDAIGDRWTLLILRDLQAGPARFQDLERGLGVATNLLSSRLAALVDAGLVSKHDGDRHSPYILTDLGRQTDRVLWELAQFGGRLPRDDEPRQPGNARLIALPLRIMLQGVEERPALVVRLLVDGDVLTIRTDPASVEVSSGVSDDDPDLVVRTGYLAILDAGEGRMTLDAFAADHVEVLDGAEHATTFLELLGSAFATDRATGER